MNNIIYGQSHVVSGNRTAFVNKVFGYFALALLVSGAGAWGGIALLGVHPEIVMNPLVMWGAIIAELALVFTVHLWQEKVPLGYALFVLFALLSGFTLTPILLSAIGLLGATAGMTLIFKALFAATCTFAAAGLVGWTTGKDLSSWGGMLVAAVVGLIITGVVNIFLQSTLLELLASGAGVVIFTIFTAYDIQRIKAHYSENMYLGAAISLYLDFINLFISILRLMLAFSRD